MRQEVRHSGTLNLLGGTRKELKSTKDLEENATSLTLRSQHQVEKGCHMQAIWHHSLNLNERCSRRIVASNILRQKGHEDNQQFDKMLTQGAVSTSKGNCDERWTFPKGGMILLPEPCSTSELNPSLFLHSQLLLLCLL